MHTMKRGVRVALWAATAAAAFGIGWLTPPPHTSPPAPDDVVASLRAAMAGGDVIERQRRTASLLEHLDPDVLPQVVALYERMIPVIGASELETFIAAWARFDPIGALEQAASWPHPELEEQRKIGVRAAMHVWAQADPLAARLGIEQIAAANPRLREGLRRSLVTGWVHARRGQDGLAAFLADYPAQNRWDAVGIAVREFVRRGGVDAALGWAEPILRDEGYDRVFKRWVFESAAESTAQWDPERAAAWALEHSQTDYAEEGPGIVARHWSQRDGPAAMAWLGEQPAGARRDKAVRDAFLLWSKTDPRGAGQWLDSQELTPFHDPVLEIKAQRLVAHAPGRALVACERIQDTTRQQSCIESTARSWYAQDAVAAETWLQQSALDEEARSRVRKVPRQQQRRRPR
jgi:hypothetical protein